jgi:hypothetical protein
MRMGDRRTCLVCGTQFPATTEYCPVCVLREALDVGAESGESSSEDTVTPAPEDAALRFEHYELEKGEDGMPVELGRGAMGVTYKAFDVDLRCPVTLKVISEKYLGDESARLRFLRRRARRPASVIQTLPQSSTWVEPARITSTRWSLWKGKRSKTLSNAQAGLR